MTEEQKELIAKLLSLLQTKYGATDKAAWQKLFAEYDTDKDGKISPDELSALLSDADIGNIFTRGLWVSGIVEKLDANKSGGIELGELLATLAKPIPPPAGADMSGSGFASWGSTPSKGGAGLVWVGLGAAGLALYLLTRAGRAGA